MLFYYRRRCYLLIVALTHDVNRLAYWAIIVLFFKPTVQATLMVNVLALQSSDLILVL